MAVAVVSQLSVLLCSAQLLMGSQTYLPLFLPPGPDRGATGTGTEAPGARAPT